VTPTTRRQFIAGAAALAASRVRVSDAVRAAIPLAAEDPERPAFHFRPPAQWNNDPNGTLFYRGWHHLFYQLNPRAPVGGNQHWGHARSRDLVNWEHLPIALAPSVEKGERAIFSGGAIAAADGRPRLIYTSIGHPQPQQWMAIPDDDDLIRWVKYDGNPVLTTAAHGALAVDQWRDPFMFTESGRTYMVCGGSAAVQRGGAGQVQLYRAMRADLTRWAHVGTVFQALERETYNIECPNLFKLDGKWVLITSPHRACEYYIGELDLAACRFVPETHGILDAGDAYASNISYDDQGRTLLWLWGRTNTPAGRGWNGVMVMPRVLSIGRDGALRQQTPREFSSLRGPVVTLSDVSLNDGARLLDGVRGDSVEIEARFAARGAVAVGFELRPSASEPASTVISLQRGQLMVGGVRAYVGNSDRHTLRLFLDRRCLEVYVDDGAVAVYKALDAAPRSRAVAVFARTASSNFGPTPASGTGTLESLRAWPMAPASFSLDRFAL
jgi:beta-fructofuranosidase